MKWNLIFKKNEFHEEILYFLNVFFYSAGGDLHTYLTHLKGRPTYLPTLIKMCEDAACGMAYLEKKGVIHR